MERAPAAHLVEEQPHLGEQQVHLGVEPRAARQGDDGAVEVLVGAGDARRQSLAAPRPARPRRRRPATAATARGVACAVRAGRRARAAGAPGRRRARRRRPGSATRTPRCGSRTRIRSATSWLSASRSVLRETPRAADEPLLGQPGAGAQVALGHLLAQHPRGPVGRGAHHRAAGGALGRRARREHRVEVGEPLPPVAGGVDGAHGQSVASSVDTGIAELFNNLYGQQYDAAHTDSSPTEGGRTTAAAADPSPATGSAVRRSWGPSS